ncbi:sulfatase family protein [Chitinophaga sp. RAB17]|uniref:sulfatase family protein n=1 Tax=Chitinophaga sp. RAB17 TaxID=3233049 RepID=UPI003F91DE0E
MRQNIFVIGWLFLYLGNPFFTRNIIAQSKRPNILFCIADDASYPFLSAYGCNWVKSPAFDQVARQGILFTNAYTPNAKCAPSRSCIITGRNSWQLEAAANHWSYWPGKFKSYPEILKEHGYFTGFTGKGCAPVITEKLNGQERELTGQKYSKHKTTPPTSQISAEDYATNFADFLNAKPKGQPFCFWYGGREPHRDYEYGSGIRKGGMHLDDITTVPPFWPDNDSVRTDMLDYAFELQYFDQQLMKILEILKASGELDNTIIVVTADNGMPFPRVKGQEYEYSNHEPLAVMWKNGIKNPGRIVSDFVSFIDFAPTFLELAGIKATTSGMQPIEGKSLTDIFYSDKAGTVNSQRSYVLIGKERHDVGRPNDQGYPIRGIVTKDYLYIHNFKTELWPAGNPETGYLNVDGSPTKKICIEAGRSPQTARYWQWSFGKRSSDELYQLQSDRECLNNLANNPLYTNVLKKMEEKLFFHLKQQKDPRMFGKGDVFDQYPYADKTGIHFYERYQKGDTTLKWDWIYKTDFDTSYPKQGILK